MKSYYKVLQTKAPQCGMLSLMGGRSVDGCEELLIASKGRYIIIYILIYIPYNIYLQQRLVTGGSLVPMFTGDTSV